MSDTSHNMLGYLKASELSRLERVLSNQKAGLEIQLKEIDRLLESLVRIREIVGANDSAVEGSSDTQSTPETSIDEKDF